MIGQNLKDNEEKKPNSREMEKLKRYFPQFFSKDGEFKLDMFKDFLGEEEVDISKEGYELKFLGKSYAKYLSSLETETYISPDSCHNEKDENKNSENLYIVGDNLDALKHMLGSYSGKIKCIYIDPPYNTGTDGFVYPDNFQFNKEDLSEKIGITEEEAGRILELAGKSTHSAWMTFMYPRLTLARDLLSDDGVIFISIDDNEQANLKLMCDEVFGEENHLEDFIWVNSGNTDNQDEIIRNHEYILCYSKNKGSINVRQVVDPNVPAESKIRRNFVENSMIKNGHKNPPSYITLPVGFPCSEESIVIKGTPNFTSIISEISDRGYINRALTKKYNLSFPLHEQDIIIEEYKLQNSIKVFSGWANNKQLQKYIDNNFRPIENEDGTKYYYWITKTGAIYYRKEGRTPQYIQTVLNNMGTTEKNKNYLESLGVSFDYPKPLELISYLISIFSGSEDYILDFFSGSATSAESVLRQNIIDKQSRNFILVQIPEKINPNQAEYELGYRSIDEIGRARIEKAAEKIKKETGADIDYGYKLYYLEKPSEKTLIDLENFVPEIKLITDDMISIFDNEHSNGKESILSTWLIEDGYGLSKSTDKYKLNNYNADLIDKTLYIIDEGLTQDDSMVLIKRIENEELNITRIVIYVHSVPFNVLHELRKNLKVLRNNKNVTLIERF